MKKIIAGLALLFVSATCFADPPPLVINNQITTPDYIAVAVNGRQGISNNQSLTLTEQQIYQMSVPVGDAYQLSLACTYNGVYLQDSIIIFYNKLTGTKRVSGECISQDGTLFFVPQWDGNPTSPVNIVSQTPPLKK